jgi:hypothetical protein
MNFIIQRACLIILLFAVVACNDNDTNKTAAATTANFVKGSYGYDSAFLTTHSKNLLELSDHAGQSKVLLSTAYQGRVMTSTADGDSGSSCGWINYKLISSGEKKKQFNPVGGEERFWIGPEGGQYSLYFKKGDSFNIAHWQVPAVVDTTAYDIVEKDKSHAVFSKNAVLTNYSGTVFTIAITRKIQLLDKASLESKLKTSLPADIHFVAFETDNQIKNTGSNEWKKESGLLSIWLLGMMPPTDETKIVVPFSPRPNATALITKDYFGDIPPERLLIKDSVLFFRCDGKSRSKIGMSPLIAKPIAGSFDFKKNILTVIIAEIDKNGDYVNSKWEIQKEPYKGDGINAYNDGPLKDGTQLGPFYEIESSSAAKELRPGGTEGYRETTCHFRGTYAALKNLATKLLGVDLDDLKKW